MITASSRTAWLSVERLRGDFFPWVLAAITGLDYFDNSIFSFFASYIAGGINASPDELVWASSAYAVAAVLGILQQQWWIERFGYRRYVAGSMLLYCVGAVAAALSGSSLELALARGFQGYFIGPMMGTCRILIQMSFTPQRRPAATRAFLLLIVLSSALAPLIGGQLVAHFDWRALFACTAPVGVLFAALALLALPETGNRLPEERGSAHFWPYLVFAFAQGALQIVMQQVRFQLFSASPGLILLTVAGLVTLGWFIYQQWHHPAPLMRLHALREKVFQAGLVLYMFYYFISTVFSYLISRFLESGLGFPVENTGRLVGVTSLISASALFVYLRYAKLLPRKKWIIVPGFAVAAFAAAWMTRMSPGVGEAALIVPLLLRGLLLLFIVLPVANLTFRIFPIEEFAHGYRLKNIVRQLTISFATASVIIVEQHRQALHQTRLAEFVNPYNPVFQNSLATLTHGFVAAGRTASDAHSLAIVEISRTVAQQASFLASLDGFYFLIGIAICGGLFAAWQKQID
ncbi:Major facilitator superfamily (MFS) multidrug efflux pump [Paraburkholderia ribeironis]|uniref:Major facilitator superfamily (MFS) multidrug efflux pump n=1 Tax=Paraburkholderia ribeironis TaxID=1247936 RepID=A0A1N7SF62_9BURK|nr:MFS transporter [Paraburkholderia ribeironis]SIT46017.1 Major facilitator superfamily (MFS) multidrug efflux pump [Paraburkholderia ribeironis]